MPSTQIDYLAEAGRTTYDYRPRVPLIAPQVAVWCLIAGLPVAVTGATLIAVFDLTHDFTFAETAAVLTVASALVLYVFMRLVTRSRVVLSVTFDVLAGTAEIQRHYGRLPVYRCPLLDVTGFQTESFQSGFQRTCTLVMQRSRGQDIPLLELDERCHAQSQVVNLMDRLNVALEASQNELIAPPPPAARRSEYIPPTALRPAMPRHYEDQPPADEDSADERY